MAKMTQNDPPGQGPYGWGPLRFKPKSKGNPSNMTQNDPNMAIFDLLGTLLFDNRALPGGPKT